MRPRKRFNIYHKLNKDGERQPSSYDKQFSPDLEALMENCFIADIDPSSCIPLCLVRAIQINAVQKLKALLTGKSKSSSVYLPGYFSGSPTVLVIPLENELRTLLEEYFSSVCETEDEVQATIAIHSKWYGIIDGCQLHQAIMELRDELPSQWIDFRWKVTVLQHTNSLCDLRKLARAQNERNKRTYTYDVTIYDLLSGLRIEYDNLLFEKKRDSRKGIKGVKITSREIAESYDGSDHSNNTSIRQAASVAIKLSPRTIKAIGEVVNKSCADVIVKSEQFNELSLETEEEVMAHHDCRLFKAFVCFGALRSASAFLNAMKSDYEEEQINTIHRIRHHCELTMYKPVQSKVIAEQFELSILARKEEETFLRKIGMTDWPPHMETARENLLRTTLCDKELYSNRGNDDDVLPSLWRCYKSLYPAKALMIETGQETPSSQLNDSNPPTDDSNQPLRPPSDQSEEEHELTPEQKEEERIAELQGSADMNLINAGIRTYTMPISQFTSMTWTTDSKKVDMVFSCITDVQGEEFIQDLPDFCKLVLNPGSYVFLISTIPQFVSLGKRFKDQGFKVSEHPFEIIYDVSTIQRRTVADFPQRHGDIALLCRTPGDHPGGFNPFRSDDDSVSHVGNVDQEDFQVFKRIHFASLLNVTACRSKLKRPKSNAALFSWEKNIEVVSRIVQMFCPFEGTVIDPYPGPLTTALSCLKSNRACISISADIDGLQYAKGRLRIHASKGATMEQLDEFSRPINSTILRKKRSLATIEAPPSDETTRHPRKPSSTPNLLKDHNMDGSSRCSAPDLEQSTDMCPSTSIQSNADEFERSGDKVSPDYTQYIDMEDGFGQSSTPSPTPELSPIKKRKTNSTNSDSSDPENVASVAQTLLNMTKPKLA